MTGEVWLLTVTLVVILIIYTDAKIRKMIRERQIVKLKKQGVKINRYDVKEKSIKIYSLETGKEINGDFVLGSGGVNEEIKYYFYIDYGKGKKIQSVDADDTILIETKGIPKLVKRSYDKNKIWTNDNEKEVFEIDDDDGIERLNFIKNILYIPKNTIKQEYSGNIK